MSDFSTLNLAPMLLSMYVAYSMGDNMGLAMNGLFAVGYAYFAFVWTGKAKPSGPPKRA